MSLPARKLEPSECGAVKEEPSGHKLTIDKLPSARTSYPLGPEHSSYHMNYPPYLCPPHPSLLNSFNNFCMPPYPYYPYSYPPPHHFRPEHKKIQKKVKKEVIDLQSPIHIKVEQQEEVSFRQIKKEAMEQMEKTKNKKSVRQTQAESSDKYSIRTNVLQHIFKKLLHSMVSFGKKKMQFAKKEFQSSLRAERQLKQQNQAFCETLFSTLWSKFESFKKTKQEIIKYIIRRTYHNAKIRKTSIFKTDFQKLQQFHDRNLSFNRSMNTEFLKKEFSNKLFLVIYKEFIDQMDDQFQRENQERITRFAITLASAWIEQSITIVQYQKKLPWIQPYSSKIKTVALELLQDYEGCEERSFLHKKGFMIP